jgi:hypothetical protein
VDAVAVLASSSDALAEAAAAVIEWAANSFHLFKMMRALAAFSSLRPLINSLSFLPAPVARNRGSDTLIFSRCCSAV